MLSILRREKPRLVEEYGLTKLGIFGSVARDEAGPGSDVDVIVTMPPDLFAQVGLMQDLTQMFGVPVDVVRDHEGLRPFFRERLARDGVYV